MTMIKIVHEEFQFMLGDKVVKIEYDDNDEGVNHHPGTVFLLFVGKGGSLRGYNDKNLSITCEISGRGYPTCVIKNPEESRDYPEEYFDKAINLIKEKTKAKKFFVMGYSAGGHFVGRFAYKYPEIKKILLVNPVLRVNNSKLLKALNDFSGTGTIVIGDQDPDFFFAPLLDKLTSKIDIVTLPGVNHQFSHEGGVEDYINLPLKYLFNE